MSGYSTGTVVGNTTTTLENASIDGNNAVADGGGNGLFYSTNAGQTWTQTNVTTGSFNSTSISGNFAIAASNSNLGVWYSVNSGSGFDTWTQAQLTGGGGLTTGTFVSVSISGTNAVASSVSGILFSTNAGQTWTQSNIISDNWKVFLSGLRAIAGAQNINAGLWYSSDGGSTWTVSNINDVSVRSISMSGSNAVAAFSVDNGPVLPPQYGTYYSTNYGQTWTQTSSDNIQSVAISGSNAIAGSGNNLGILYSTDGGQTWLQSSKTTGYPYTLAILGSKALSDDQNTGIWYSNDGGATWNNSTTFTTSILYTVAINSSFNSIAVGFNTISYSLTFLCFHENTELLCIENGIETYKRVSSIKVGDELTVYKHGTKKVKYIKSSELLNDPTTSLNCLWKMKNTNFIVSGGHSILVDPSELTEEEKAKQKEFWVKDHFIEDKQLLLACVSDKFIKITDIEVNKMYHLVLENCDIHRSFGVYAKDGILTETMSELIFKKNFE